MRQLSDPMLVSDRMLLSDRMQRCLQRRVTLFITLVATALVAACGEAPDDSVAATADAAADGAEPVGSEVTGGRMGSLRPNASGPDIAAVRSWEDYGCDSLELRPGERRLVAAIDMRWDERISHLSRGSGETTRADITVHPTESGFFAAGFILQGKRRFGLYGFYTPNGTPETQVVFDALSTGDNGDEELLRALDAYSVDAYWGLGGDRLLVISKKSECVHEATVFDRSFNILARHSFELAQEELWDPSNANASLGVTPVGDVLIVYRREQEGPSWPVSAPLVVERLDIETGGLIHEELDIDLAAVMSLLGSEDYVHIPALEDGHLSCGPPVQKFPFGVIAETEAAFWVAAAADVDVEIGSGDLAATVMLRCDIQAGQCDLAGWQSLPPNKDNYEATFGVLTPQDGARVRFTEEGPALIRGTPRGRMAIGPAHARWPVLSGAPYVSSDFLAQAQEDFPHPVGSAKWRPPRATAGSWIPGHPMLLGQFVVGDSQEYPLFVSSDKVSVWCASPLLDGSW